MARNQDYGIGIASIGIDTPKIIKSKREVLKIYDAKKWPNSSLIKVELFAVHFYAVAKRTDYSSLLMMVANVST